LEQHAVMIPPKILVNAQRSITVGSPYLLAMGENMMEPTNAPALPLAALIPFNVERHSGEKVMEGNINVVVFGP